MTARPGHTLSRVFLADNSQRGRILPSHMHSPHYLGWSSDPRSPLLGAWSSGVGGMDGVGSWSPKGQGVPSLMHLGASSSLTGRLSPCWVWDGSSFGPEVDSRYGIMGSGVRSGWVHIPALLLLALRPWASCLTSISSPRHSLCKVEIVTS